MFDQIISLENLLAAWKEFRRGKRHKLDVQSFERNLEDNLFSLHEALTHKTYQHGSYEKFYVFDPKFRVIHKATVRDRVIHHAIYRVLSPIFDISFIYDSYSCRLEKGTHKAVNRLEKFLRKVSRNYTQNCWVLKLDIAKFFDSINHQILFNKLSARIFNNDVLWLLQEIISSFSLAEDAGGGDLKEFRLVI